VRALALLCLVVALLAGGRAFAHAQLVAADPAAGTVAASAPAMATLTFSEPVRPLAFRWFPPGGAVPVDAAPEPAGERIVVPLPADPSDGTWLLSWRVVSADGHPVGGSHVFSVGAPSAVADAPAAASASAAAVGRALLTLALIFGAGGAAFLRLVDRGTAPAPVASRLALLASVAVGPLAVLALGLHGLDLAGLGAGALVGPAPWVAALASPFAATAAASLIAALVAIAGLGSGRASLVVAAWALAAVSFALFGHAATAAPRWLMAPSVAVHAAAFVFWIGALPGLAERAAQGRGELAPTLRRFSALAMPLVALLVLSGAVLSVVQVRHASALLDTAYGRLLLAKLAAVAALLLLAALNRFRLTPAIARGEPGAPGRLRRSVGAEILLGLVVLGLASGFRLTPPPRAIAAVPAEASVHLHGPMVMADVTLRPGRAGANAVEIALVSATGETLDPLEVRIGFSDPARGVEPIRLEALRDGETWKAGPVELPYGGDWRVRLDVLVDDFAKATLEATATVGAP